MGVRTVYNQPMAFRSRSGWAFALLYIAISVALISSQGLFGESFIALILGLPWTLLLAAFEFFNFEPPFVYVLVIAPMVLNAFMLYWIGARLGRNS